MARVSRDQLDRLGRGFSYLGITRREDRLRLIGDAVGRTLHSSSQLTEAQADALEERLRTATPHGLRQTLADIIAREEKAAAALARAKEPAPTLCEVPGKAPTEGDLEKVRRFGEFLEAQPPRGKVVGFMCQRSGRGKGCTPITEDDAREARNALAQLQIDVEEGQCTTEP